MPETPEVKKPTSPLLPIGLGILVLIFLICLGALIYFKFFAKNSADTVIGNQTGADIGRDASVNPLTDLGAGKVPDNFPKDFPIYPDAKVTSALTGPQEGQSNGFVLSLSTPDAADKVNQFYDIQLKAIGWTMGDKTAAEGGATQSVSKANWTGTLTVLTDPNAKGAVIVINLSQILSPGSPNQ